MTAVMSAVVPVVEGFQAQNRCAGEVGESYAQGWAWFDAARGGDRDAFGQLYRCYSRAVAVFLARLDVPADLVDDLTSETFLAALGQVDSVWQHGCPAQRPCRRRARQDCPQRQRLAQGHDWRYIERLRAGGYDPLTWLRTTAKDRVGKHVERAAVRREFPVGDDADRGREDRVSTFGNPEHEALAEIDRQAVASAVAAAMAQALIPAHRRFVQLVDLDGRSAAETAETMGRNLAACHAMRLVALRRLADVLDPGTGPGGYHRALNHARTLHAHPARRATCTGTNTARSGAGDVPARFVALLREQRHAAGLSQSALARALGYSASLVSLVERGERVPSPEFVVRADDLLGGALLAGRQRSAAGLSDWQRTHSGGTEPGSTPGSTCGSDVGAGAGIDPAVGVRAVGVSAVVVPIRGSAIEGFCAELCARRRAAGLSQRGMAAALGYSKVSVHHFEHGTRIPGPDFAHRADALLDAGGALLAGWQRARTAHARRQRDQASRTSVGVGARTGDTQR